MPERPIGTVTFLFTDIEGSTTRWEHSPDAMRTALARHDGLLRSVMTTHGGYVFKMVGDAVYAAFAVPADAVAAAVAAQHAVSAEEWGEVGPLRVRMALHTGAAQSRDDDYFGPTLNRVARVLSTGYGGQVLLSVATYELVRDNLPAGVTVKDLGEHALKDLLRPEHLFQLVISGLPADFPPLKTLDAHSNNLPIQPTPFIGREQEVATVRDLLRRVEVRLLTLTGPGGTGKTRLGLQVAAELSGHLADGVYLIALAPISDPALVMPTIAETLGIREIAGQSSLERLKEELQKKQMLLLLDNFEQVVNAASQVADLLSVCPKFKILVTSREVLRVRAEHEFVVPPLELPDPRHLPDLATLSHYAAVALFFQRAQAVKPDFQITNANARAIAEICARLDGLPLALELAAARLKLLSPQALLARLEHPLAVLTQGPRDVPARQQTLRNTIAWSYGLLTTEEQRLFRRLSVFIGGCTLEAAEAVCQMGSDQAPSILDEVESLLDKNLLLQTAREGEEPRLVMLETIREFGLECLAARGEAEAIQANHAAYYIALVEEAWRNPSLAEQRRMQAPLEQEYVNLRAALQWSVEQGGVTGAETVLRLSVELVQFWVVSGRVSEGRRWLELALAVSEGGVTLARARGLLTAGRLALTQDDFDQAEALLKQSQKLYQELYGEARTGAPLQKLGLVALARGNYTLARRLSEEALTLVREESEIDEGGGKYLKLVIALALDNLIRVAIAQAEYARAHSLAEECLALSRQAGDRRNMTTSLFHLALLTFSQGEQAVARSLAEECLAVSRGMHYQWSRALSLGLLGLMALQQGDETATHALLAESLRVRMQVEDRWSIRWGLYCLGWVAFERWDRATARVMYEKLLSILGQLDDAEFLVPCLEGLGSVVASQGAVERPEGEPFVDEQRWEASTQWAVQLWGMAEALREESGIARLPIHSPLYERTVAFVRARLGEQVFAAAWAEGRTMKLEKAIDNALKSVDEADKQERGTAHSAALGGQERQ